MTAPATPAASVSVVRQIAAGDVDGQLDVIFEALRARRKYLSAQLGLANQAALTPGTRVTITGNLRPKYLVGLAGTVAARSAARPGDLTVDIDEGQYTGRYGRRLNVPAACLARTP